jgi:hypothetical protein
VKDVANVVDMGMIDQQHMHAAGFPKPRVGRAIHRSPGSDQYPHAGRIFEQQRPITDAELARGGAERCNNHVLRTGYGRYTDGKCNETHDNRPFSHIPTLLRFSTDMNRSVSIAIFGSGIAPRLTDPLCDRFVQEY